MVPALFLALVTCGIGGIYYVGSQRRPPANARRSKILDPGLDPTHSFPSGHVGTAIALYGGIVVLSWTYARAARWWVTPLLLVLPLVVLVARLYQGAHHLSDVLTSLVFASIWVGTVAALPLAGSIETVAAAPGNGGLMIVAFSITPMAGDETGGVTEAVAEAVRVVRESGLPNETNAMFTNIEGEWDEVMAVVKQAVDVVAAVSPRVGLVLKADIRPGYDGQLTAKVQRIEEHLAGS